jgi:hypothetical protein
MSVFSVFRSKPKSQQSKATGHNEGDPTH